MSRMVQLEDLQAELTRIHNLAGNTCVRIEGITWGATALNMENKMRTPRELPLSWLGIPPKEDGLWWWWNQDGPPVVVNIGISLTGNRRFFATMGQHGWNRAQWVEDMGGLWMRLPEPELPAE